MQNESWQRALRESRPWTREEAERAIAALDASGMMAATFARKYGTSGSRFGYWRKRLREGGTGDARLVPVRAVETGQARLVEREPGRVTVVASGGLRVEMEGVSAEWVAVLVRLLRESEG
jgi:transposase-like protein